MNNNKYAKVEPLSVIVVFSVEVFRCFVKTGGGDSADRPGHSWKKDFLPG